MLKELSMDELVSQYEIDHVSFLNTEWNMKVTMKAISNKIRDMVTSSLPGSKWEIATSTSMVGSDDTFEDIPGKLFDYMDYGIIEIGDNIGVSVIDTDTHTALHRFHINFSSSVEMIDFIKRYELAVTASTEFVEDVLYQQKSLHNMECLLNLCKDV